MKNRNLLKKILKIICTNFKISYHFKTKTNIENIESSVIINAARGPIIDNMALYRALKDNKIYGAGLDVTDPEPIPSNHPLLTLDNCLIVPHIASASVATRKAMSKLATTNLINGLMDSPLSTCVNQEING